jgi:hypothetical protein
VHGKLMVTAAARTGLRVGNRQDSQAYRFDGSLCKHRRSRQQPQRHRLYYPPSVIMATAGCVEQHPGASFAGSSLRSWPTAQAQIKC